MLIFMTFCALALPAYRTGASTNAAARATTVRVSDMADLRKGRAAARAGTHSKEGARRCIGAARRPRDAGPVCENARLRLRCRTLIDARFRDSRPSFGDPSWRGAPHV